MAKKTIPVNNYNDSNNYGTSGAAPSLYSDKHYLDGDGFLYGLGMASLRQIVKGKDDDITTKYFYWSAGKSTASKLGLKIPAIAEDLAGTGLWSSTGTLNLMFYTKKDDGVNVSGLIIPEASDTYTSGLKINTGKALYIGNNSTDTATYGKLNVLYDDITIKLDSQGRLKVDGTAIVPNIQPSDPITVNTSGNNKIIGLKLKNTTESGHTIYASGLDADSNGLFVKLGNNSIVNGNNGLFVDWSNFPKGNGIYYNDQTGLFEIKAYNGITVNSNGVSVKPKSNAGIAVDANGVSVKIKSTSGIGVDSNGVYLKAASTSEIGGVKLGTPATIQGANPVNLPLFLDSNNVGNVRMYVFNSKAPSNPEAANLPYSASYIDAYYSTKTEVTAEIATAISDISGREYKIFLTLPAKGESQSWADFYAAYKKYIALVSNLGSEPDAYKEYILIVTNESTGECHWEQIGDTKFTTDNFVAKTDVLTQAEVASIVKDVFGF